MTLKAKLAALKNLYNEEENLKAEIQSLRNNINYNYKKYSYEELRDKYNNIDFSSLNKADLTSLMLTDFNESNLTEIQKQEIYRHNMQMLQNILENTKTKELKFNSLSEAKNYLSNNLDNNNNRNDNDINNRNNLNNDDIKTIEIKDKNGFIAEDDFSENEEDFDEEKLEAISNKIDIEYEFNLKILKTYCIYCHYRFIKLPTKTELDDIKEILEGWIFIPREEFGNLEKNNKLIFLTLEDEKVVIKYGKFKYKKIDNLYIKCNDGKNYIINKYNPLFRKIDINKDLFSTTTT